MLLDLPAIVWFVYDGMIRFHNRVAHYCGCAWCYCILELNIKSKRGTDEEFPVLCTSSF
jgi:hypothetical protein